MKWLYKKLRLLFRYLFTRDRFNTMKVLIKKYPWDYGFHYELVKSDLIEMHNYFIEKSYAEDAKECARYISLAIEMIDLGYLHSDSLWEYRHGEYVDLVNVNRRNQKRFETPHMTYTDADLYALKARHLFHKIMLYKSHQWWD